MEDLSASLAPTKASVDELSLQMLQNEGVESKLSDVQETLAAILKATKEQTAALIAAVQEQTKAIEKLAAPARESGKRKRDGGDGGEHVLFVLSFHDFLGRMVEQETQVMRTS